MRLWMLVCLTLGTLAAADGARPADGKGQPKGQPPAPKVIKPLQVPASAVEKEPGSFYFTDSQGKKWIYRKTPFGVVRLEESAAAEKKLPPASSDDVKAADAGDSVKFERPGPFGMYRWTKKKSELTEMERAAWERALQQGKQQGQD